MIRLRRLLPALLGTLGLVFAANSGQALAAASAPGWVIDSFAKPTHFVPGDTTGDMTYTVTATNLGAGATQATRITLDDDLPPGVTASSIEFYFSPFGATNLAAFRFCDLGSVSCALPGFSTPSGATLMMVIHLDVDGAASGPITNKATISGGAPTASTEEHNAIRGVPAPFGVAQLHNYILGADGQPETQAGAHPYQLTTKISLANRIKFPSGPPTGENGQVPNMSEDIKDAIVDLPIGLIGSAVAAPKCTQVQLTSADTSGGGAAVAAGCADSTIVGRIVTVPESSTGPTGPLFNMVPEKGAIAQFGYLDDAYGAHVMTARLVPSPDGYVLRTFSKDIPQIPLTDILVSFFGDPSARNGGGTTPVALLTTPAACNGNDLKTTIYADSWKSPGRVLEDGAPDLSDPNWKTAESTSPPVDGCNKLHFDAALEARPDTSVANSPSGLDVTIKVPQSTDPDLLGTPPLKKAIVKLPEGYSVNPGSADGLGACAPAQIGLDSGSSPKCPDNSKIGTLELETPLLDQSLEGSIYLASQNDNPFGTLLAIYLVVDDADTGVVMKMPGRLDPDPATGQITSTFDNNPQFPFSELKLHFKGGPRGTLATPGNCGTFETTAAFTPWSAPDSGDDATPTDPFAITSGCVSGFHPSFSAGTENPQAGARSPFVLSFQRSDRDEELSSLKATLPPGLLAKVAGVPLCGDADANAGTCSAGSQVGSVTTGSGVGANPLFLPGTAYLTGPYKGAPYGLAVVVPAKAGPFDLGTVVVRQSLSLDPTDAHVTATSDPFPTILQGIPLRLRRIDVKLDRPGFMVNPTSCDPMKITGALSSVKGTEVPVSSRFQVGGCSDLAFSPKLQMKLIGRRSVKPGKNPALEATLTQPVGQANLKKVQVALPLSLALDPDNSQVVCPVQDAAKIACPSNTKVGTARAETSLLPNPLEGSVYLVQGMRTTASGKQVKTLPKLLVPLSGRDGVQLNLTASSSVSKGKLVTTFDNIPDAPVSKFTLNIAGGPKGILVVTGKKTLCQAPSVAAVNDAAQSGKTLAQSVKMTRPCTAAKTGPPKKAKRRTRSR